MLLLPPCFMFLITQKPDKKLTERNYSSFKVKEFTDV